MASNSFVGSFFCGLHFLVKNGCVDLEVVLQALLLQIVRPKIQSTGKFPLSASTYVFNIKSDYTTIEIKISSSYR